MRIDAVVAPTRDLFAIGDVLSDNYEIRSVLGQGGMGQVYEAYDRALIRTVAIKAAWPNVGAAAVRREAQALAAIRHPSMVSVYACQKHGDTEYVVMERVAGENLEAHIRRRTNGGRPFGVTEAIAILASIAEGLAAVHRAGVAHRDVKPDNVMLAPGGRVVIMDFGVFVPEFEAVEEAKTSGSPAYMAPETISGNVGSGGAFLVDVYAFGVLAFHLLTGALPFVATDARALYLQHLSSSAPTVRSKRVDVPARLDELVSSLMAKDPSDRPQSMEEVAHLLRSIEQAPSRGADGERRSLTPPEPSLRAATSRIIVDERPFEDGSAPTDDLRPVTRRGT